MRASIKQFARRHFGLSPKSKLRPLYVLSVSKYNFSRAILSQCNASALNVRRYSFYSCSPLSWFMRERRERFSHSARRVHSEALFAFSFSSSSFSLNVSLASKVEGAAEEHSILCVCAPKTADAHKFGPFFISRPNKVKEERKSQE